MDPDDTPPACPKSLRTWLLEQFNKCLGLNQVIEGDNIEIERSEKGIVIHGRPGDGSGSGGDDNLETVTGAVNGVPSTLQVQTDGEGWTALV